MVDGSYHMVTLDYTVFPDGYVEGQEIDDKSIRYVSLWITMLAYVFWRLDQDPAPPSLFVGDSDRTLPSFLVC